MPLKPRRQRAEIDQTLVYLDGPQLVTLKGSRSSIWIAAAVVEEGMSDPFFCSQVSIGEMQRYFDGEVDLHYLFAYSTYQNFKLFDYPLNDEDSVYLYPASPKPAYLPEEGFFSRDHTEDLEDSVSVIRPSAASSHTQTVDIDGRWDLSEIADFSDKMAGVYSFHHAVRTLATPTINGLSARQENLARSFNAYPMRGGFSYVNFWGDLYSKVPRADRLGVQRIEYASPGQILLDGNRDVFNELLSAVVTMQRHYGRSKTCYQNLHYTLSKNDLLSASREVVRGTKTMQDLVMDQVTALAASVSLHHVSVIHSTCEDNWIFTAKIVLAYFRRLDELFRFYAQGRIKV